MRKFFFILFVLFTFKAVAQPLNNEWIDYSKTYYKFKIGTTGLFRISQATLAGANLQNTPAEQFQLWRNGVQIPIYTTVIAGILGSNDYIEFWGTKNDGKADKYFYRDANNQLSDRVSLETDTAAFYLTVNSTPTASNPNLRFTDVANTIPTTTPAPEPYFIYTQNYDFQDHVNPGYAQAVGEYVYSSAYDMGEFCSSPQITGANPLSISVSNFNAAANGPAATLKAAFVATIYGSRSVQLGFNTDNTNLLVDTLFDLTPGVSSISVPISTLVGNPNNLTVKVITTNSFDVVVCNYIQLTYPHTFNFSGQTSFNFSLPATASGNYLQITNFSAGAATPVLYDFTNNVRYTANTSIAGILQFQLPASTVARNFVLVNEDGGSGSIKTVKSLQQRSFTNYALSANQGDYLIISNKLLGLTGAVEAYRAYRSNTYNAKLYDIDELEDQFGYGIKKHPLSIKNFIRYASSVFTKKPAFVFFIGKGVTYDQYRANQTSAFADRLNLVPTWGNPASDAMLISSGLDPNPTIGFGRLSAVSEAEVNTYLSKVREYEGQQNVPQTITDRSWMKNVIHITGADDAGLYPLLRGYMNHYQNIITSPFFGGLVYNFDKTTTGAVTAVASTQLISLINNGVSLISYFGHGSNTVLDYANINDPYAFNNKGKYPMFLTNGCSVGNFFDFDTMRMGIINTFSEKYIFAPNKGAIGVIGNTHFGLTNFLDTYSTGFYNSLSSSGYNKEVSNNMLAGIAALKAGGGGFSNYGTRIHAEETVLEGDPAIKIYASSKPDYVVEPQNVVLSPSILSVSNTQFTVKAYLYNIGKATNDTAVSVLIQRIYPNGKMDTLFKKRITNFNYEDSVVLTVPIVGSRDKGTNQIIVSINNDKAIDEISFNNNTVTSSFAIFDNGITPIYPYNYAIVNKTNIQLIASTANPISPLNSYVMDIDTTALFNSSFKVTKTVSSVGGAISFDPGITLTDSTVYYWRVAQVPASGPYIYTTSSFVYLNGTSTGFNQSHLYQHLQSSLSRMYLDSVSRRWMYLPDSNNIVIRSAVFDPNGNNEDADFQTFVNGFGGALSACVGHSLIFNVYDPVTLLPFYNQPIPSTTDQGHGGGFMNSATFCGKTGREFNFEFNLNDASITQRAADRQLAKAFLDWIPQGYIVTARLNYDNPVPFANEWANDSVYYGANNTLYTTLQSAGFSAVDSFDRPRTFVLIYKKSTPAFNPRWLFSKGTADAIQLSVNLAASDTLGYITSPQFGPSTSWKLLKWRGLSLEAKPGDVVNINLVGVDNTGNQTQLMSLDNSKQDIDISGIDALKYPYLKLIMRNADSINLTPYQLRYWRLIGDMVPEGGLAPNIKFSFTDTLNKSSKSIDTFQVGEQISVAVAFKNISDVTFRDSIIVNVQVVDNNNNINIIPITKLKKLVSGDTAVIYFTIDASKYSGNNTLYINVNPNNSQPEQYHFNNFIYKSFYVTADNTNPVLDVTFDGVHILNNDIVSSKPDIKIKLVDNARYFLLNDTSLVSVKLVYPDGSIHAYSFNTDTLRFTAATNEGSENAALIDFTPYLPIDGTYQLIVTGKNRNGNTAGLKQYTVQFEVKNTPMISNVFNYPNPFTTSTAFVFTLTGSEVPQDMKIEILTITGKIVKEITKEQLGNIHIGNNITTYKWDGTDMFGAKLGNGVYLYRVVTKLNGNNLDKYGSSKGGTDTDQFFKGGYGKMYLLR